MGRVGFFSSLFANRTSNTPFLYVSFAVRGSTMCGISSSFRYRLFAESTLIFNALSVDSSLISSFSTPGSSVTTTTSFPVSMTSTSGSLSRLRHLYRLPHHIIHQTVHPFHLVKHVKPPARTSTTSANFLPRSQTLHSQNRMIVRDYIGVPTRRPAQIMRLARLLISAPR